MSKAFWTRARERIASWLASKRGQNQLIALALLCVSTCAVASAQRQQGIARDEVVYMDHGSRYADWWLGLVTFESGRLSEDNITKHFGGKDATANNREHPPLMKTLFGLSERLFHDKLGWTSEVTGYRLPAALLNGILISLVFLFVTGIWGRTTGLLAAGLTLLLPRAFFHAGLATFDAPVVTFWFAALVTYYRAWTTRFGFLWFGVCVGLCLATKHNGIMLPAVFIPHALWVYWNRRHDPIHRRAWHHRAPRLVAALFLVGPLVAIALWPWLWFDTFSHVRDWIAFHLGHVHYNYEYLGENWNAPPFPWHVALVTTALVVPVTTLVAAAMGAFYLLRRWHSEHREMALLLLSAGVAMGPFFLGSTPIFGAEKHWAPAMPSLCIAAALGITQVAALAARFVCEWRPHWRPRLVHFAIGGLLVGGALLAAASETWRAQPYALTHYNALAGGAAGGADLGMNRQFWGVAARGVLPFLNEHAPDQGEPPVPVYSHDASPAWGKYRAQGLLAAGLPDAGREEQGIAKSKIAIVIHELHFNRHDYLIWKSYGTVQPSYVLTVDGVPVVSVYRRDDRVK